MKSADTKAGLAYMKQCLETEAGEKILVAAMDKMFTEGKWEIPDDAIVGIYAHKVDQLEAQNTSLLALVKQLAAEVRGEPIKAGQRIDAIAAARETNPTVPLADRLKRMKGAK
ncbi:MAG: hypothetical protein WCH99_08755 [Verrucomicrobiota bacterium]